MQNMRQQAGFIFVFENGKISDEMVDRLLRLSLPGMEKSFLPGSFATKEMV